VRRSGREVVAGAVLRSVVATTNACKNGAIAYSARMIFYLLMNYFQFSYGEKELAVELMNFFVVGGG